MKIGKVYLTGAGPGDPDLLTLKGARALALADCVVYDLLCNADLLKLARPGAELIFVGKKGGKETINQKRINNILIKKARAGKTIVRLKGGDPFVFGRGGEEAERLSDEGIPFEIIPGVTSAAAAPAYAGIPLSQRRVLFVDCDNIGAQGGGREEEAQRVEGARQFRYARSPHGAKESGFYSKAAHQER